MIATEADVRQGEARCSAALAGHRVTRHGADMHDRNEPRRPHRDNVDRRRERTGIRGLYLAGDASEDVQFVIVAAAEGAKAAIAINKELHQEDCP